MFVLVCENVLRLVIHTANLIEMDWKGKTQALWMFDAPKKSTRRISCDFECDLCAYVSMYSYKYL